MAMFAGHDENLTGTSALKSQTEQEVLFVWAAYLAERENVKVKVCGQSNKERELEETGAKGDPWKKKKHARHASNAEDLLVRDQFYTASHCI